MRPGTKTLIGSSIFALLALALSPLHAQAQVIFSDHFNAFDATKWSIANWQLGRTHLINPPVLNAEGSTTFVTLELDTYHPDYPGALLRGAEIYSWQTFSLPRRKQGLSIEARVRMRTETPGFVASFFTWGYKERRGTTLSDEMDFEYLTNWPVNNLLVTTWNDWDYKKPVYNDGIHHAENIAAVAGLNRNAWTVLKLNWLKDRTEWYVNDVLVHSTAAAHANDPMNIRFNLWAPASTWSAAYSAGLQPTADRGLNQSYFYDIDYITVTEIP